MRRSDEDTRLRSADSDTVCLQWSAGQRVRIATGSMEGLEGTIIEQRTAGRVLVRLQGSVYVELHNYCLESMEQD